MGYYISMFGSCAIPVSKEPEIRQVFRLLQDNVHAWGRGGSVGPGGWTEKWYSWVKNGFADKPTVEEMFSEWDFDLHKIESNFIISRDYNDKIGQEDFLLAALAPLVTSGEFKIKGEDDERWKWKFENGKVYCYNSVIRYVRGHSLKMPKVGVEQSTL